ncbi:hypothetical protein [Burkholderia multivorans]|uniref:hypothetical protein n=1 Tax=Burkholderia multivorans TaxID=87883 RepID=UPI0012DB20E0|nr:hypothetical protein [Burkholderia multivorans]MBU9347646.1 hypothetical protein [Burkholderia multivorans]MDR8750560.1 hypothetical protein [Burkholderia multivorans]MDR8809319.1 hypothetical protein [Burkholderia multivorans]
MASSDGFDPTGSHDIDFLLAVVDPYTHPAATCFSLEICDGHARHVVGKLVT